MNQVLFAFLLTIPSSVVCLFSRPDNNNEDR